MAYDVLKREFNREHIYILEIDGEYCDLTYSVSPCTAALGVTGDAKCYNTLVTCQDTANYTEVGLAYRFCEPISPHPIGLNGVIPSIANVNITPGQLSPEGGIGTRSSISITFDDHPYHDRGIDKYVSERGYIATDRGTYWTKWRVRNPYYQGYEVRLISAYIENGEYKAENAQIRYYVLESVDVSSGRVTIKCKDPLKALDDKRIKIPTPSTGQLSADITSTQTTFTLKPAGIGSEYPVGAYIRIGREVMLISSKTNDDLTVTRAQYNTEADSHEVDDNVQLCKRYDSQNLDQILVDIVHEAFPPPTGSTYHPYIDITQWQSEVNNFLTGAFSALITEPTGATKLLNELGTQIPHYLYWDDRAAKFYIKAIRQPDSGAPVITEDGDIISDLSVSDNQDMRISTVFVFFGQIDPTEKLDEARNYRQYHVREDTDSVSRYGSRKIKEVFSRWITGLNKAAAIRAATRIGRRYSDAPRAVGFTLAPKDSGLWLGDPLVINHRKLVDFSGAATNTQFQVLSVEEREDKYRYKALEHLYGDVQPGDEEPGVNDVVIAGNVFNYNMLDAYQSTVGSPDGTTNARFIVETSAIVGSEDPLLPAMETGTWPAGSTITIVINGKILGKGGKGREGSSTVNPNGGDALFLDHPVSIDNSGIIGGGGGGGDTRRQFVDGVELNPGGGGGAGFVQGSGGKTYAGPGASTQDGEAGTLELGGNGGSATYNGTTVNGYDGGDLGVDAVSGGNAGYAIRQNGNTVTYINAGDIRGTAA